MNRSIAPVAVLLLALSAHGQTSAPQPAISTTPPPQAATAGSLPSDPAALLKVAAQVNGLHGADLQPWHVRATWTELDPQGDKKYEGGWEEWWAGEKKYKITVHSGEVQQTTYGTDRGRFVTKLTGRIPGAYTLVESLLIHPVPDVQPAAIAHMRLEVQPFKQGNVSLDCVLQGWVLPNGALLQAPDPTGASRPAVNRYCFGGAPPVLRVETTSALTTTFNSIVHFQDRFIARTIRQTQATGQQTNINVDLIEAIESSPDADFAPPPDAELVPEVRMVAVSAGVMARNLISGDTPQYPADLVPLHIQGTVVLKAHILKDGTIGDLSVISGPKDLQQPALDAVKKWRYLPYMLNGEPVEVMTQINIVFRLKP